MKTRVLVIILFVSCNVIAQSNIGLAWAKNSVNSPIFRKNSVTSFNGFQYAAYYDSVGSVVLAKRKLDDEKWNIRQTEYKGNVIDAHCSISIGVDGDGYLHLAWDHHNDSLRYCKSIKPGSLIMSKKQVMVGSWENDVTYPEFYRMPNGDLIFFYRFGISGRGNMVINKYKVADKQWERLHDILIDGENERNAYWQCCVSDDGTIHVSWVWRETWGVETNNNLCYAKSADGGKTWQNSKNELYKLPITKASGEVACFIPQNSELINQTSMYADADGNPYIASYWRPKGSLVPQYFIVYHENGEWKKLQASNRKEAFSLSGGGTKKIPISRPQIVMKQGGSSKIIYLVYRDEERGSKVSLNSCALTDSDSVTWKIFDVTNFSVGSWEPTFDIDLWKDSSKLDLFVQKMGQGDGENIENIPAQDVYIWRVTELKAAAETFNMKKQ